MKFGMAIVTYCENSAVTLTLDEPGTSTSGEVPPVPIARRKSFIPGDEISHLHMLGNAGMKLGATSKRVHETDGVQAPPHSAKEDFL